MYKIAIPSYKREKTITNKTLNILIKHHINPKDVYIFLADENQKQNYLPYLPKEFHDRIILNHCYGIKDVRNFMNDYFDEGEKILFMDDDLKDVLYLKNNKLESIENLDLFIKLAFDLCYEKNCNIFSVYPVENAYFMDNSIKRGLIYMMGGFMGVFNRKNLKVSVCDKEDFERSILYFLDSPYGCLRFNNVCCKTKGYTGIGGMNSFDRSYDTILKACDILLKKYPKYCSLNLKKKSNKPEIKLKNIIYELVNLEYSLDFLQTYNYHFSFS